MFSTKSSGNTSIVLILIFVVVIILGGILFLRNEHSKLISESNISNPTITPSPSPINTPNPDAVKITKDQPIKIIGDLNCETKSIEAIELLRTKALKFYESTIKYIGKLECLPQGSGVYSQEYPARIVLGETTLNAGSLWFATYLIHESCHVRLYKDYFENHPNESVPETVYSGKEAEVTCLDYQKEGAKELGADQSTIDYIEEQKNTNYWEVPYEKRYW